MRYTDRLISSPPQLERPVIWGAPTMLRVYATRELDLPENTVSEGRTLKFQGDGVVTNLRLLAQDNYPIGNQPSINILKNGRDALFSTGRQMASVTPHAVSSANGVNVGPRECWIPVRKGEVWRIACETGEKSSPESRLGYEVVALVEEWCGAPTVPQDITETVWYLATLVCPPGVTTTEQVEFVRDAVVTGLYIQQKPYHPVHEPSDQEVQILRRGAVPLAASCEDVIWPSTTGVSAMSYGPIPCTEPVHRHESWRVSVTNNGDAESTIWVVFRTEEQRREPW
jgi:hypothetical protein